MYQDALKGSQQSVNLPYLQAKYNEERKKIDEANKLQFQKNKMYQDALKGAQQGLNCHVYKQGTKYEIDAQREKRHISRAHSSFGTLNPNSSLQLHSKIFLNKNKERSTEKIEEMMKYLNIVPKKFSFQGIRE